MKRNMTKIIIVIVLASAMIFSGCYTKVVYSKFSKTEWKENHKYQYFHEYNWGKEWNAYYWSPTTRHIFEASSRKKQASDTRYQKPRSHSHDEGCLDNCITSCILMPLDIINALIIGDDDDDADDNDNDSQDKPQRRRGTE